MPPSHQIGFTVDRRLDFAECVRGCEQLEIEYLQRRFDLCEPPDNSVFLTAADEISSAELDLFSISLERLATAAELEGPIVSASTPDGEQACSVAFGACEPSEWHGSPFLTLDLGFIPVDEDSTQFCRLVDQTRCFCDRLATDGQQLHLVASVAT